MMNCFQERLPAKHCNIRVCSDIPCERLFWRQSLCQNGWQAVDSTDVRQRFPHPRLCVSHSYWKQLHCHVLPRLQGHPVRIHDRSGLHLPLRHSPSHPRRHYSRSELSRLARCSLQSERCSQTNSREEMVGYPTCEQMTFAG